jgi:hypothetical protein
VDGHAPEANLRRPRIGGPTWPKSAGTGRHPRLIQDEFVHASQFHMPDVVDSLPAHIRTTTNTAPPRHGYEVTLSEADIVTQIPRITRTFSEFHWRKSCWMWNIRHIWPW